MNRQKMWLLVPFVATALLWGGSQVLAAQSRPTKASPNIAEQMQLAKVSNAQRKAAAEKLVAIRGARKTALGAAADALLLGQNPLSAGLAALNVAALTPTLTPNAVPDYYNVGNYANSPLPELNASGNPIPGTGIRKFVDLLPGLGAAGANNLGQFIPVAVPDQTTYPGADYYVIALVRYTEKLHSDLPPTMLQGYVQLNSNGTSMAVGPHYLGPTIIAQRDRPVRVKFINKLPVNAGGNLFLPVDKSIMGAGDGPQGGTYSENRATIHLHGGLTPWISDGTPHQWTTPASENSTYTRGVSVYNVPDMDGGREPSGTLTFYYSNQQSARLMFYHDHSYGITRLNVYAGEAAPDVLQDPVEQKLVNGGSFKANGTTVTVAAGTIPAEQIPLVIQDKTFVPKDSQLAAQDPTWDKARWGGFGNLWMPHVYMPNQIVGNDALGNELGGVNAYGRWDYSPWFFPPFVPIPGGGTFGTPEANPLWGQPGEPALIPGMPSPSITPEAFNDTPLVNGTAYPYLKVGRKAYRFRILNACNDRTLNLQLYYAKSNTPAAVDGSGKPTLQTASGEVSMTVAAPHPGDPTWPARWPTDGRDGGVPDPSVVGPSMIQIGSEGGFLPSVVVLPNTPVGYEYFRRTITVLNVTNHTLLLGPAERADVIIDFSGVPDGSKLIMYNDAPAPMPGFDSRLDYYTGDPDQTTSGGATSTIPGYGPNTRTIMQFDVSSAIANAAAFNLPQLQTGLQAAYAATQDKPIVPMAAYGSTFATTYPDNYAHNIDATMTFTPIGSTTPVTFFFQEKAVVEGFDMNYGRMNANLGGNLPNISGPQQGTAVPFDYVDPPTDIATNTIPGTQIGSLADGTQIWRIDHQGVDTHLIHFHLDNVQVIQRIALDGQLFPPDANELGWKETIRMNPGQDVFIAMRPQAPTLPFKLPDSVRVLNPVLPEGATFTNSQGNVYVNSMTNFGWEYVWHCHILGHEENDMMRPFAFEVSPAAPSALSAVPAAGPQVTLHWVNNAVFPAATNYVVQRARDAAFTLARSTVTLTGTPNSYLDTGVAASTLYYYRVRAESAVGYSEWTAPVAVTTPASVGLPTPATGLHITSTGRTFLTFAWTNGTGATSLTVQYSRSGSGGPWITAASGLSPATTARTITGLSPRSTYWIRVLEVNGSGSRPSSVLVAVTLR
jgi:FtsP/CotA-like multicopper oxidase with cupredoxin domain